MRNSILVKNTTYYTSSLRERESLKPIYNLEEHKLEIPISYALQVHSRAMHLQETKAGACSVKVINLIKDEFEGIGNHGISLNVGDVADTADKFTLVYDTLIKDVVAVLDYNIVVLEPADKSYKVNAKCFHIKDSNFNAETIDNVFEGITLDIADIAYKTNCVGTENILPVKNMSKHKKDDIVCKTIEMLVTKKQATEYKMRNEFSIVIQTPKKTDGYINEKLISIDVSNMINGGGSSEGSSSGGDLKRLSFVIQQMSFFEFKLRFESKAVKDVFNLPKGLFFDSDGQRIIGTPMSSGRYEITVIFDNNSMLDGVIDVPKLNREL